MAQCPSQKNTLLLVQANHNYFIVSYRPTTVSCSRKQNRCISDSSIGIKVVQFFCTINAQLDRHIFLKKPLCVQIA